MNKPIFQIFIFLYSAIIFITALYNRLTHVISFITSVIQFLVRMSDKGKHRVIMIPADNEIESFVAVEQKILISFLQTIQWVRGVVVLQDA